MSSTSHSQKLIDRLPHDEQKPPKKKKNVWRIVFIIAAIVLTISLICLGVIGLSYVIGQKKSTEQQEHANVEASELSGMSVDWAALKDVNPDIVAWLYIPNTPINYPVVQGEDNDYYLTHDFNGGTGWVTTFGSVFMDYRDNPNWSDDSYFFYGHHMQDGSMFASIAKMTDQSVFDSTRTIYLLTPLGNFQLRSFALIHTNGEDSIVHVNFESPEEMQSYVQELIDTSVVNPGYIPQAKYISKIFAFSTCDSYSAGRNILFACIEQTTVPGTVSVNGTVAAPTQADIADRTQAAGQDINESELYRDIVGQQ